jgi:two-component system, NtrC family, sensor kinase
MRKFIKIFLLLIIPATINAQQSNLDSLKRALTHAASDSAKWVLNFSIAALYEENNSDSTLYYAETSLLLARQNNKDVNEASLLDLKGYELMKLGRLADSYQCFQQALKIADNANGHQSAWLFHPYENHNFHTLTPRTFRLTVLEYIHIQFGHLMGAIGKTDQQIIQYKESQKIAEEIGDTTQLGFVNMNLGSVYVRLGKLDSAILMEETAVQMFIQTKDKRYLNESYTISGLIYLQKQNNNLAVQYFHKAFQSAIEQQNFGGLHSSYFALSNFYLSQKNKDSSLYYTMKDLSILQLMSSKDLGGTYSNLSISYELKNKMDSAYKYKTLALIYNDSSYKAKVESLTKAQNLSFEEQLKLQELEKEKADTKNKIRTYAMLSGIGFLLMIAFLLYRNNLTRKKSHAVLQQQKEEIQSALSELKSTQAQLIQSEKMASLGELTAGIAHEIQNPLNFVNNFSDVNKELLAEMRDEIKNGNIDEVSAIADDVINNEEKINHHGKRADAIVKGMLQHSRSSTGQKEPVNINAIADECLRLSYHGLRARDKSFNANLKTNFDDTIDKIPLIQQDFVRVLVNLFNNAFYAVNEKTKQQIQGYDPTVSVSTRKINDNVVLAVMDNGNGIPQKVIDKIFQPFFTTKPTGQGTGLGLSLSYDIVKAHGGDIKVNTRQGEFTEFAIQLPIGP